MASENNGPCEESSELQLILDSVPATICHKDGHNRFLRVNRAAAEVIGLPAAEIEGKTCEELFPPVAAAEYYADDQEVMRSGKPKRGIVERMRTGSGTEKWMLTEKTPYRDAEGKMMGVIVCSLDITEMKRTEEALRESKRELQDVLNRLQSLQTQMIHQERLSALGQMAVGVAHDLNNALVPVLGYTDLLLSVPGVLDDKEKAVRMLGLVRTGAMNVAETVRRMREFYRSPDLLQEAPVDLCRIIGDTVALTRPRWKEEMGAKGVTIDIRTETAPTPLVLGEEHELTRLLTNLIFNAVDAMPKGGSITLRLHPHVSGRHAVLEVQDTGVGMSGEVRLRCFDPFFSTKDGPGVGLGLPVSDGIVQRHGGSIEIQSEPGKGTRVIVQLPCAMAEIATHERRTE